MNYLTHPAHRRTAPIGVLPPVDACPPELAELITTYTAARERRAELVARRRDQRSPRHLHNLRAAAATATLDGRKPKVPTAVAAEADLAAIEDAIAALDVELDAIATSIENALATHRAAWLAELDQRKADARHTIADALATIEAESERMITADSLRSWITAPRLGRYRAPVGSSGRRAEADALAAHVRRFAGIGPDDDAA